MKSRHTVKVSKTSRQWFVLKTAVPSYKAVLNMSWKYSFYLHVCFQLLWICNENFHIKLLTNFSYVRKSFPCCIGWKRSDARLYAVVSFFKFALVNCIHCCYKVPFVVIKRVRHRKFYTLVAANIDRQPRITKCTCRSDNDSSQRFWTPSDKRSKIGDRGGFSLTERRKGRIELKFHCSSQSLAKDIRKFVLNFKTQSF